MIVNPAPATHPEYFLAGDGNVYELQVLEGTSNGRCCSRFFLADDGTLYEVSGGSNGLAGGRFFLGEDGSLFEIQPESLRKPCRI
jgi:hypothetical protein